LYLENHTASLGPALQSGAIVGSAGKGRFAAAARVDYAEPAAVVLTTPGHAGKIYEFGGDVAYTLVELASEVGKQSGKKIVYYNLPEQAYQDILEQAGLPADLANFIADSDKRASQGELYTASRDLSGLIGHPTTTLTAAVAAALPQ
jgi:NAD(P)H dehydrogenase (quinone)